MGSKFCSACGSEIDSRAEICMKCGVRQSGSAGGASVTSSKSRTTAALLAFLLGGIGAHKFYLGQTGAGIVYIVFCWTFIPAFIAFIEFIIFLTMSDEAFAQKHK